MILEVLVNCVEGCEVIIKYLFVIFCIVEYLYGILNLVMEYVVGMFYFVILLGLNCSVINIVL